jgi:hypothetical protein
MSDFFVSNLIGLALLVVVGIVAFRIVPKEW